MAQESAVYKDPILASAQDEEGISVQSNLQVSAADELRRAHVDIHIAKLAVTANQNPSLVHIELEVPPFQPGVRSDLHLSS